MHPSLSRIPGILPPAKMAFNCWIRINAFGQLPAKKTQFTLSARIDSAPSGTHFAGAAMKWFLRLTEDGVGMHVGILPGYPASHGCIRQSVDGAKLFYDYVKIGTPVDVGDY